MKTQPNVTMGSFAGWCLQQHPQKETTDQIVIAQAVITVLIEIAVLITVLPSIVSCWGGEDNFQLSATQI